VVIATVAHLWAAAIEQRAHLEELRDKVAGYARLATALQTRLDQRKDAASSVATTLFTVQRHESGLKRKVRDLELARYRFVRVVGKEQMPNKPYDFMVVNSSVAHQVKRGEKHPFYDNSWAVSQPVQVWAPNMEEARDELERAYPVTVGFKIVSADMSPAKAFAAAQAAAAEETLAVAS
jgi:hypothetical protein